MGIREEFRLRKLWFNELRTERFCLFQWRAPGLVYVIYRLAMAAYILAWLIVYRPHSIAPSQTTSDTPLPWGVYLTSWTYVLLTIYFLYHALVACLAYFLCRGSGLKLTSCIRVERHNHLFHELEVTDDGYQRIEDENPPEVAFESSERLPIYFAFLWMLFSMVTAAAIMVTLVFWTLLAPNLDMDLGENENLQLHLFNSILILIEHCVTAVPVRLLHVIYPIIYCLIYVLFSIFYWVDDHSHVIYPILDWGKASTAGYIVLVGVVVLPLIQLAMYGVYRLRLKLFSKFCLE